MFIVRKLGDAEEMNDTAVRRLVEGEHAQFGINTPKCPEQSKPGGRTLVFQSIDLFYVNN